MSAKVIALRGSLPPEAFERLRAQAEAFADEFDPANLPDTDEGLIEAERGRRAISAWYDANEQAIIDAGPAFDDIVRPITDDVENGLDDFIEETPPGSLAGAAVKLRALLHLANIGLDLADRDDDIPALRQVIAFLEAGTR